MLKYYQEENYKKGVQLFKDGAKAVRMDCALTGECKVVFALSYFKSYYKLADSMGEPISAVSEWRVEPVNVL